MANWERLSGHHKTGLGYRMSLMAAPLVDKLAEA